MKSNNDPYLSQMVQESKDAKDKTDVSVVILGPAKKGHPGLAKRLKIKEHLENRSHQNHCFLPEETEIPSDLLPGEGQWPKIDYLVGEVDIVFAVLVDDITVHGVFDELSRYGSAEDFRKKANLIMPKEPKAPRSRPLAWDMPANFPKENKLPYTKEQFDTCEKIRDWAEAKVERCRSRKWYDQHRRSKGMPPLY